jgi:hypothetical protein
MVFDSRGVYGYGVEAGGGVNSGASERKGEVGVIVSGCPVFDSWEKRSCYLWRAGCLTANVHPHPAREGSICDARCCGLMEAARLTSRSAIHIARFLKQI